MNTTTALIRQTLVDEVMRLAEVFNRTAHSCSHAIACRSPEAMGCRAAMDRAKDHLRNYAMGLAELTPESDPLVAALRRQEIASAMAIDLGWRMSKFHSLDRMDFVQVVGQGKAMLQTVAAWAAEFDAIIPEMVEDKTWTEEIENFVALKLREGYKSKLGIDHGH